MGAMGMVFECGHMNGCHKTHNGRDLGLVAPVFPPLLGLSDSFNGSLFRALRMVLYVNNSLIHHVATSCLLGHMLCKF